MPFYEYECASCKFYSEVMQKITDAPLKRCPSCGKNTLKKLLSAPVFRLKGGGWYETDFKSDQEAKRNLAQADKADKDSKPAEAATEAKPSEAKPAEAKPADSKPAETKATPARSSSRRAAGGAHKPRRPAKPKSRSRAGRASRR
jgi:putative FmdB family regulatory protein